MPNHCNNALTIEGDEKLVAEIWERHFPVKDGEHHFDFNTVIPYPTRYTDQDKLAKNNPDDWSIKDGFNSGGYEWCISNWGTKWNAYEQEVQYVEGCINAEFCTAWGPPEGVFAKLCEMYPNADIFASYEEWGQGFEGTYQNQDGNLYNDHKEPNLWKRQGCHSPESTDS